MARLCLLILILFCFCCRAEAQTILQGHIYERNTSRPVAGIRITNTNNREMALSDAVGAYQIKAKSGDKIIFEGFAYRSDTVYVSRLQQTTVYLTPKINALNEVEVKSATPNMTQKGWYDPMYHGQKVVMKSIETVDDEAKAIIRVWWADKDSKKSRKSKRKLQDAELMDEIRSRFSPTNVGRYVPLKGQTLQDFCDLYLPTTDMYRSPKFDFVLYLNDSYKAFMKLPPEKRKLPPLIE